MHAGVNVAQSASVRLTFIFGFTIVICVNEYEAKHSSAPEVVMPRSLPLGNPPDAMIAHASSDVHMSGTVSVYDPAMCCTTGVCGPASDPALLTIARDLRWLEAQGVTVTRYGLSQEPAAFVAAPKVVGLMQAFDDKALPATLVNGEVLAHGQYPTRDELVAALGSATDLAPDASLDQKSGCCTPGSGCC